MTISFKLLAEILDEDTPVAIMATIELLRGSITILELMMAGITSIMLLKKSKLSFVLYLAVLGISFADEKIGTILLRLLTFVGSAALVVCDKKKLLMLSSILMIPGLYMQLIENNPVAIELLDCGHRKLEYHHFIGTINSLLLMTTLLCVVMHHFYITGRKNNHTTGIEQTSFTEKNTGSVQGKQSNADAHSVQNQPSGGNTNNNSIRPVQGDETKTQTSMPRNNGIIHISRSRNDYTRNSHAHNNENAAHVSSGGSQSGVTASAAVVDTPSQYEYALEQHDIRTEECYDRTNEKTKQKTPRVTISLDSDRAQMKEAIKELVKLSDPTSEVVNPRSTPKRKREEDPNVAIKCAPMKKQKTEKEVSLKLKRWEDDTTDSSVLKKRKTENKASLNLKRSGSNVDKTQNSKKKRKISHTSCSEIVPFRNHDRHDDDNKRFVFA